jgi:hypothetical protein
VRGDFFGDGADFDKARCGQRMVSRNASSSVSPRDCCVVIVRMLK